MDTAGNIYTANRNSNNVTKFTVATTTIVANPTIIDTPAPMVVDSAFDT